MILLAFILISLFGIISIFVVKDSLLTLCFILIALLSIWALVENRQDKILAKVSCMHYGTIQRMISHIKQGYPNYAKADAEEFNYKVHNICRNASMITSNDLTWIEREFAIDPNSIPIVTMVNKKDLAEIIQKKERVE